MAFQEGGVQADGGQDQFGHAATVCQVRRPGEPLIRNINALSGTSGFRIPASPPWRSGGWRHGGCRAAWRTRARVAQPGERLRWSTPPLILAGCPVRVPGCQRTRGRRRSSVGPPPPRTGEAHRHVEVRRHRSGQIAWRDQEQVGNPFESVQAFGEAVLRPVVIDWATTAASSPTPNNAADLRLRRKWTPQK